MKYVPPIGGAADDPYIDGNPAAGVQGSDVPAAAIEHPMREIVAVIEAAGLTPDALELSQLLQAIQSLPAGRLIGVQIFTASGTYTPTPGTKSVVVEGVGGGGGGGGVPATGSGQQASAGGGSAGAYGRGRFTASFAGVAVTIGIGGTSAAGSAGSNGGTTSFGALMSCPGGNGAPAGIVVSTSTVQATAPGNDASFPSGANIFGSTGIPPTGGLCTGSGLLGGNGGSSLLGAGPRGAGSAAGAAGAAAAGYGAGGAGVAIGQSQAAVSGGPGKSGLLVVYEYA